MTSCRLQGSLFMFYAVFKRTITYYCGCKGVWSIAQANIDYGTLTVLANTQCD